MPFEESPPGEGSQGRGFHFGYVGTKCGSRWNAFTAGRCVWLQCHPHKKTKPCCAKITRGELLCPFCQSMPPSKPVGFLPVWREVDSTPKCVVLYESQREVVDRLELHAPITLGREGEQSDGTWIARSLAARKKFETALAAKLVAHDVTPSLLRMWKLPTLTGWWECSEKNRSDNALSLSAGTAVTERGEPFSPVMQAAAKRFGADVIPAVDANAEELAEVDRELLRAVQRGRSTPSTNGKHQSKKG